MCLLSIAAMFNSGKGRMAKQIYLMPDVSNQNIYDVSQGNVDVRIASPLTPDQKIDRETVNLINWLAQEQGINPEAALKKAVVTAAYIHDVVYKRGGKLLVQHPDGSVREIFLK
jgi:hypothetical protein